MKPHIKHRSGYKHQLAEHAIFQTNLHVPEPIVTEYLMLGIGGELVIKNGYAWDGASGPALDTKNARRASLVHDALYQLMRMRLLARSWKKEADIELEKLLIEDGMWWPRRTYWLWAVRHFGNASTDPKNAKPILIAP